MITRWQKLHDNTKQLLHVLRNNILLFGIDRSGFVMVIFVLILSTITVISVSIYIDEDNTEYAFDNHSGQYDSLLASNGPFPSTISSWADIATSMESATSILGDLVTIYGIGIITPETNNEYYNSIANGPILTQESWGIDRKILLAAQHYLASALTPIEVDSSLLRLESTREPEFLRYFYDLWQRDIIYLTYSQYMLAHVSQEEYLDWLDIKLSFSPVVDNVSNESIRFHGRVDISVSYKADAYIHQAVQRLENASDLVLLDNPLQTYGEDTYNGREYKLYNIDIQNLNYYLHSHHATKMYIEVDPETGAHIKNPDQQNIYRTDSALYFTDYTTEQLEGNFWGPKQMTNPWGMHIYYNKFADMRQPTSSTFDVNFDNRAYAMEVQMHHITESPDTIMATFSLRSRSRTINFEGKEFGKKVSVSVVNNNSHNTISIAPFIKRGNENMTGNICEINYPGLLNNTDVTNKMDHVKKQTNGYLNATGSSISASEATSSTELIAQNAFRSCHFMTLNSTDTFDSTDEYLFIRSLDSSYTGSSEIPLGNNNTSDTVALSYESITPTHCADYVDATTTSGVKLLYNNFTSMELPRDSATINSAVHSFLDDQSFLEAGDIDPWHRTADWSRSKAPGDATSDQSFLQGLLRQNYASDYVDAAAGDTIQDLKNYANTITTTSNWSSAPIIVNGSFNDFSELSSSTTPVYVLKNLVSYFPGSILPQARFAHNATSLATTPGPGQNAPNYTAIRNMISYHVNSIISASDTPIISDHAGEHINELIQYLQQNLSINSTYNTAIRGIFEKQIGRVQYDSQANFRRTWYRNNTSTFIKNVLGIMPATKTDATLESYIKNTISSLRNVTSHAERTAIINTFYMPANNSTSVSLELSTISYTIMKKVLDAINSSSALDKTAHLDALEDMLLQLVNIKTKMITTNFPFFPYDMSFAATGKDNSLSQEWSTTAVSGDAYFLARYTSSSNGIIIPSVPANFKFDTSFISRSSNLSNRTHTAIKAASVIYNNQTWNQLVNKRIDFAIALRRYTRESTTRYVFTPLPIDRTNGAASLVPESLQVPSSITSGNLPLAFMSGQNDCLTSNLRFSYQIYSINDGGFSCEGYQHMLSSTSAESRNFSPTAPSMPYPLNYILGPNVLVVVTCEKRGSGYGTEYNITSVDWENLLFLTSENRQAWIDDARPLSLE